MVHEKFLGRRTTSLKIISIINKTLKTMLNIMVGCIFVRAYFDILLGILFATALACKPAVDTALCIPVSSLLGHKV